jgi:hypothetical protein
MADLFEVEVIAVDSIATDAQLLKEKALFKNLNLYYAAVRELAPTAPENGSGTKTIDQLLGPMVAFVRGGGSCALARPFTIHAFLSALVDHLAAPTEKPSPLPLTKVTLRITEIHPQAGMRKDVWGGSHFVLALLGLGQGPNPIRDQFGEALYAPTLDLIAKGPLVIVDGSRGKANVVENADGQKRKQADVTSLLYAKWATHLEVGRKWQSGVSP